MVEGDCRATAARGTLGTIRNAMRLLELMNDGHVSMPLSEMAERSGLSLSTTHRVLRSLVEAGLVAQDGPRSRYSLGPEVIRLSEGYLARLPVLRALAPYLVDLRDTTQGTVLVGLLVKGSLLYADRVDGEDAGGIFRDVHRIHDALGTAAGRVLLGHAHEDIWKEAVTSSPLGKGFSDKDRTAWATARAVILGPEEFLRPSVEVAVPVADRSGAVVAALAAVGSPRSFTADVLTDRVTPALIRAAAAAGQAVGDF
ncbi:MAG: IclR family transcriptional regulator, acetate operon repressor [Actinomycetota bacterium]|nr:IclR family transcriptional regulator, acetate operon repressor [Actinomycetota bacterium]